MNHEMKYLEGGVVDTAFSHVEEERGNTYPVELGLIERMQSVGVSTLSLNYYCL